MRKIWFQISSREQQARSNLLLLRRERTLHEGLQGQEESLNDKGIQRKKFEICAAGEEYEPTDDESVKEIGF